MINIKQKKAFDIWNVFSIIILSVYALFLLYPFYITFLSSVTSSNGNLSLEWLAKIFSSSYYKQVMLNSLSITICVTILTLIIGVPLAYFFNMYEIKGKSIIQIMLLLSFGAIPFITAYTWVQLLGRSGILTNFIKLKTGISIPDIYGFKGLLLSMTLLSLPIFFFFISTTLKNIDSSLLEASENLGCSGVKRFFKVIIPLCMPGILEASFLTFTRAFADYGTPAIIGQNYRVFPLEIYNQYVSEIGANYNFAAALSVIALILIAVLFLFQRYLSIHFAFPMKQVHPIETKKAKGLFNGFIHFYVYFLTGITFFPTAFIIYQSFLNTSPTGKIFLKGYSLNSYKILFESTGRAILNSLLVSGSAIAMLVLLAIIVAYLVVRRKNIINSAIDLISVLPYVLPGSVIGLALAIAFGKKPLILTGTFTIMILSLFIRRLPYTSRSAIATLEQISETTEEAAISLGSSRMKTFFKITVPMMLNGIISGAIISWVTIAVEITSTIMLYTTSTVTLPLVVFTYIIYGDYGYAAAGASVLFVFVAIPLLIFMKISSKSKQVTIF